MSAVATRNLLAWVKKYRPLVYQHLPASITDPKRNGLGDWTDILTSITNAAIQYDTNKTTRKQIDVNIERAKAGQDPVTFDAYGNVVKTPTPNIAVQASANSNMLIFAVVALGLGMMFMFKGKS